MRRIALAAIAAVLTTGALAGGQFQQGGSGPLEVESAMLAIKSPATNACPANAKMKAWIYTNKAGPVSYMMIRHGQGAGPVKTVVAKKINGKFVAEISHVIVVQHKIDAQYRIAARGAGDYRFSDWVPLKANCTIQLGG
ncbi:MAG: hypothetical protein WAU86_19910 [Oricola sp.]